MATLTAIRQLMAKELADFLASTATSGTTTTLTDTTWPANSTLSTDDYWQDAYLFRPNAVAGGDKVRIVKTYTPAGGIFTPDTTWTNSPSGEAYEVHKIVEPLTAMTALVNEGLKRCFVEFEITLTPSTVTAQRENLTAVAAWLTDPQWVRECGRLVTGEVRSDRDPYTRPVRGKASLRGGTIWMEHPDEVYATTDTVFLHCIRPAYTLCQPGTGTARTDGVTTSGSNTFTAAGGSFTSADIGAPITGTNIPSDTYVLAVASSTSITLSANATATGTGLSWTITRWQDGLSLESDTVVIDQKWAAWAAIVEAYRRYAHVLETGGRTRMGLDRDEASRMFSRLTDINFTLPPLRFYPLVYGGPRQRRGPPGSPW